MVKKEACKEPSVRRMSGGMKESNMIAIGRTVACSSMELFATTLKDLATFITKKQSRRSLTQKLTLSTSMRIQNTETTSFKSTHEQRSTSLEKVTLIGVTTQGNGNIFRQRWTTNVAIGRAQEWMVTGTEKVP